MKLGSVMSPPSGVEVGFPGVKGGMVGNGIGVGPVGVTLKIGRRVRVGAEVAVSSGVGVRVMVGVKVAVAIGVVDGAKAAEGKPGRPKAKVESRPDSAI